MVVCRVPLFKRRATTKPAPYRTGADVIRRIVNLPFRVLGKAARAFQDREDAAMKAVYAGSLPAEEDLQNVPQFDTPTDFETGSTGLGLVAVQAALDGPQSVQFVDIRTAEAFSAGSLPGALHLPLATLGIRLAELPPASVKVVVYGRANESEVIEAARFLRWRGFEDAWHLEGGISAWSHKSSQG